MNPKPAAHDHSGCSSACDYKEPEVPHTPHRGRIAEMEQERIEQEVINGERRYYQSVMADELSNDPEVFEEEYNG